MKPEKLIDLHLDAMRKRLKSGLPLTAAQQKFLLESEPTSAPSSDVAGSAAELARRLGIRQQVVGYHLGKPDAPKSLSVAVWQRYLEVNGYFKTLHKPKKFSGVASHNTSRWIIPRRPSAVSLGFLVSQIAKVKGTKTRHDHFHGGAVKWREGVDKIPLSEITSNRIEEWRGRYLARFDDQPLKRQQAQSTAISIIRNAKALFSPRILKVLGADVIARLPNPLPFSAVEVGKRPRTRYKSKVNSGELTAAAWHELKVQEPDQFKIFLLAFGAGLRRGEIDRLTWAAFNWKRGTVSIEPTEYGIAKIESSHDEIDLGQDLLDYFKAEKENAGGEFVIGTATSTTIAPHWNHYRCDCTFKKLLDWLRSKGVTARNPLHTLRKEFGSLINQKFGSHSRAPQIYTP